MEHKSKETLPGRSAGFTFIPDGQTIYGPLLRPHVDASPQACDKVAQLNMHLSDAQRAVLLGIQRPALYVKPAKTSPRRLEDPVEAMAKRIKQLESDLRHLRHELSAEKDHAGYIQEKLELERSKLQERLDALATVCNRQADALAQADKSVSHREASLLMALHKAWADKQDMEEGHREVESLRKKAADQAKQLASLNAARAQEKDAVAMRNKLRKLEPELEQAKREVQNLTLLASDLTGQRDKLAAQLVETPGTTQHTAAMEKRLEDQQALIENLKFFLRQHAGLVVDEVRGATCRLRKASGFIPACSR